MARAAGMETRRLELVETGQCAPSEVELRALAAACGVDYGELIPPGYHLTLAIGAVLRHGADHQRHRTRRADPPVRARR